jgi:hypothetical protein
MNNLITSQSVLAHIWDKHQLKRVDVEECFFNHISGKYLEDTGLNNRTDPQPIGLYRKITNPLY